jgi:hypothetical protein
LTGDFDSSDDMYRFSYSDATVDRLLSGHLNADDAPPELRGVAALFEAATAPASALEVAHREAVVSAGASVVRAAAPGAASPQRRRTMLSKFLSAKIALGATAAALGMSTAAAAATGSLPGQTDHASSHAAFGLVTAASHVGKHGVKGSSGANPATSGSIPTTGPANTHAQFGLCTAFLAGNTSSTGVSSISVPQDSSTAFKTLIAENGGSIAATTAYCETVVAAHASSNTSGVGDGSVNGTSANRGQGASHRPSNTGRPANAGKSAGHARVSTPNHGGTGTADQASHGHSSTGTSKANAASGGRSAAGSGNASGHRH